ncbi:MAG: hypothetical protein A2Z45_11325 [Chloroflexi bacterium RBG_19FT_COMBO_55_16]|nr:MAG: hypothetical protein A2Z45_11325 [Chloroflexi bacterium RBG_19FT_COMBO_55_16]
MSQTSAASLLEELTGGVDERAEAAARALACFGSEILPALHELLLRPDPELRWWATRALAEVDDPQVVSLLVRSLQDPDALVRQCAALALRQQPFLQAIPDLVQALGDADRFLAHLAADALITTGEAAVPALLEIMRHGHQAARLEAVRALAGIGDPRAIPALFDALDEDSALMEYWAGEGLERMGVGMTFFMPG